MRPDDAPATGAPADTTHPAPSGAPRGGDPPATGPGRRRSVPGAILNAVGVLMLVATVLVCAAIMAPRLAGLEPYAVATGSMEPSIPTGSLVYAQDVDPASLQAGDVITFSTARQPGVPVTHRVVSNDPVDREIVTQGDANASADPDPVPYAGVRGKVALSVPVLGTVAAALSTAAGKAALAAVVVVALGLCLLADRLRR